MKSPLCATLVAVLLILPVATSQTVTIGTGTINNTTTTYPTPYGNWYSGVRSQYIIPAAELTIDFAVNFPTSIGFDVVQPGGQPCQLFEIKMGWTTAVDLALGWDNSPLTTVFGPATWAEVVGWNDHPISPGLVPAWNGADSLLIEICFWNGAQTYSTNALVNISSTIYTSALTEVDDSAFPCVFPQSINYYDLQRPNMRFDFTTLVPDWQVNSPEAGLDFNGVQVAGPYAPAGGVATSLVGGGSTVNVSSTLTGSLFDILINFAPLVPATAGGLTTLGGQPINANLFAPGTGFAFGNGFIPGFIPFPANFSLPLSFGAPLTLSGQMLILNGAHPDGFSLSQGAELAVVPSQSWSFLGDEVLSIIDLGLPFSFYGQTWNQVDVSTNGWIKFGGTSTFADFGESANNFCTGIWGGGTPTPGVAALWLDLDMANRPTSVVTVTEFASGILQVDWIDGDVYPAIPFGNVTCIIDTSGAVVPTRVILDYTLYTNATPPNEGVVGVSSGSNVLPAVSTALNLVQGGVVAPYANVNLVENLFQSFDGLGSLVPPIPAEPFDLGGLVLTFDDIGTGAGTWVMY